MNFPKNSIVTVELGNMSSGTFFVDTEEDGALLVAHPLAKDVLLRVDKSRVNTTSANIKDSSERGIDYASSNRNRLDGQTQLDLEAIAIYFAIKRKLTPRQKQTLAAICGMLAAEKFNNELRDAMNFISKNASILDDFNTMWYNNFKGLFSGTQQVTSKKQRSAIFNIAGYVLAELENPTARARK